MQLLRQASLARQGLGTYLDNLTASDDYKNSSHTYDENARSAVNNFTLVYPLGSINSEQRPTYQPSTDPSGFIVKPAPNPLESYLKQEPSVKKLRHENKDDVPYELTVLYAKLAPRVNPSASVSCLSSSSLHSVKEEKRSHTRLLAFHRDPRLVFCDGHYAT